MRVFAVVASLLLAAAVWAQQGSGWEKVDRFAGDRYHRLECAAEGAAAEGAARGILQTAGAG